jgi:RHS repeat-associated protein
LTDTSGSLVTTYAYSPYGNTTASGTSTNNTTEFTGRENDGTGLYYYRARYYNPDTGRFLSEDPAGFSGSGANLYNYAADGPTNFSDPRGLQTVQTGIGGTYSPPLIPIAGTGGVGVATDGMGDVGIYVYFGYGGALGSGLSGGFQAWDSNANTINDIAGPFNNLSVGGGEVVGGSVDTFEGSDNAGNQVVGAGGTVGGGAGLSVFAGTTTTSVFPLFNWIQALVGRNCPSGAPASSEQETGGMYYQTDLGDPNVPGLSQ